MKHRTALFLFAMSMPARLVADDYPPEARSLPSPPYPVAALYRHESGLVVLKVRFDAKGKVADCSVVRALASDILIQSSRNFVMGYWSQPALASKTIVVPVIYETESYAPGEFSPTPPNFLASGDPERQMTVRARFGANGLVKSLSVIKSSGSKEVDDKTANWIEWYWFRSDWAGKTLDIPIVFQPTAKSKKS